ncbi:M56 family metallopeptidase [Allorhodopirellula solitaria]|uniref:M56 family metallopeptidase n=1 Tax=Allorhodopirellula solitaria TaxID=2527987 RepID=UPI001C95297B|nr:M56 family metallopeptidase [Allorhodopirellula solitaria]
MTTLPTEPWQRLLVDSLWQSTLVGVLGLLTVRWFVTRAAARAWVLTIAITACVLLPVTSLLSRSSGWALPIPAAHAEQVTLDSKLPVRPENSVLRPSVSGHVPSAFPGVDRSADSAGRVDRPIVNATISDPKPNSPRFAFLSGVLQSRVIFGVIGIVWLTLSGFHLARLVASFIAVRRMLRRAHACEQTNLLDAASDAAQRVGLATPPRLLVSNQISTPMVLAYFRPVLLLPDVAMNQLDKNQIAPMFAHELAHIKRRDGWSRLWVQLAVVLMPLQPLVWWMRKLFNEACEEACDDWAIAAGSDPTDLAAVLTHWSDTSGNCRELVLAAGMSGTRSRVIRLLGMRGTPSAGLSLRWRFCVTTVAILLCGGLGLAQPPVPVNEATNQPQVEQQPDNAPVERQKIVPSPGETKSSAESMSITIQRPAEIEGRVVLKESGAPAVGARVELWNDEVAADTWTRSTTDSDGRYRVAGLPPGSYRMSIVMPNRPNLFQPEVTLATGSNRRDFQWSQGGLVKGRVINVLTEQPIQLNEGEQMDISEMDSSGRGFAGMPSAKIQRDGSFELMLSAGHRYFGMYLGPAWRGVNTDRLGREGIDIAEGETTELEIRVKPIDATQPASPVALSERATNHLAEQAAIAAIKQLGGWVATEEIDGSEHVIEVNMVYHEDERMGREENSLNCDECLSYVTKFSKLKRLMLVREQATDSGLANLSGMNSLQELYAWDATAVSDEGARWIATCKNLKTIHLSNSNITDKSLDYFSTLPKIETLSFQGNHFTNKGLKHLQDMEQLKMLVLGLGENEVNDDGLRFLSGLTNLERLGLQNSKVTDAGLRHLKSLKNLKELWLQGTDVTEAGLAELRQDLPKLEVR